MTRSILIRLQNYVRICGFRGLGVGVAFIIFTTLMSVNLTGREFWLDEVITVGHIAAPTKIYEAFHPPGYYWLLFHWKTIFGGSDLALRAFSVPWALAAFIFVWLLARRLLRPPADLLALGLFVLSPLVILYLRMARYFAMTMAVSLVVAYLLLLVADKGKSRHYILLGAAAAGLLWTDYVPSVLLIPAYLYLLYRAARRGGHQELGRWLVAAVIPLATVAPWVGNIIMGSRQIHSIPTGHLQDTLYGLAAKLGLPIYSTIIGETTEPWRFYVTVPVFVAGAILIAAGFVASDKERQPGRWLKLATWPAAVGLVAVVLSTVATSEPLPRVTSLALFAVPFAYILMAQGAVGLRRTRLAVILICVVFVGDFYGLYNYYTRQQFLNPGYNVPWRQVTSFVESRSQPTDIVIEYYDVTFCRYWQGSGELIDYDDGTQPDAIQPLEEFPTNKRRVWLVARDRGASGPRQLTEQLRRRLSARAQRVAVFNFMPLSPAERHWRRLLVRRPLWDAYVKVYLFVP